jgi:polyferredoxin
MAIVPCPECGNKMSSRAALCSRCGYTSGEVTEEQLEVMQLRRLRDKIYHLSMISYSIMAVFLAGFGWFWWSTGGFQHRPSAGPFIVMGLAGIAYFVIRALLFQNQRKRKILRKKVRSRQ